MELYEKAWFKSNEICKFSKNVLLPIVTTVKSVIKQTYLIIDSSDY